MPHAVFNLGPQTATGDLAARQLVPGIEPGGSRVGQDMKPALLIKDAWLELVDMTTFGASDFNQMSYFLKFSQELDLTPGLIIPIGRVGEGVQEISAVGQRVSTPIVEQHFHAKGTIWVPRVVGIRVVEVGTVSVDMDVHLDYEQIDVPFMDWFIGWEFLDNIPDNEREY